jgi:hypothetical protein
MYAISILLLLLVLPIGSIAVEALAFHGSTDLVGTTGKWFVFWAVGVRLFVAGIRQVMQPRFTAGTIFGIQDRSADAIVREVGFGNLAMGTLGLASLALVSWVVPAALVGGLYYGLAGLGHLARGQRNTHEQIALVSDLLMFLLLAGFAAARLL